MWLADAFIVADLDEMFAALRASSRSESSPALQALGDPRSEVVLDLNDAITLRTRIATSGSVVHLWSDLVLSEADMAATVPLFGASFASPESRIGVIPAPAHCFVPMGYCTTLDNLVALASRLAKRPGSAGLVLCLTEPTTEVVGLRALFGH